MSDHCVLILCPGVCLFCVFTRFIQGSEVQNPYSFYHWQYVDIFVYFSHHTVTIPPVCWTNAAHRHGVCVLGKSQAVSVNLPNVDYRWVVL